MTLVGCLVAFALMVTGHRPHRFHYFIYFEVGENWGGFEWARLTEYYAWRIYAVLGKHTVLHTLLVQGDTCT